MTTINSDSAASIPPRAATIMPLDYNDPAWDEPPPPHDPIDLEGEKLADLVPRLRERLRHRDQALDGERKQAQLYEAKSEALRANLDQVEAEVGSLQAALTEANDKISAANKEKRKLEKRISSLEGMLAGVKGQEYAINVATSQNTKLVLLLQEEERKQKEMEKQRQGHLDEIAGLRTKLTTATREAAAIEAKLKDQLNRRSYHFDKLQAGHDQLKAQHAELGKKYEEETNDLRAKVNGLDKQVHQLKGQPYKLLDRLQKSEDVLRVARDDCERVQREMVIIEDQNRELQRHLDDAVKKGNVFKEKMEFLQKNLPILENELASLRSRLEFERHDKAALESQLFEMSQTITQLVQRQALVEEKSTQKENELFKLIQGKDKEGRLQDQQLTAKDRMLVKQEKAIAVLEEAVAGAQAQAEAFRRETQKMAYDPALPYKHEVQAMARRRLLDLHVNCVSTFTIAEPGAEVTISALQQLRLLDLSSCAMTDGELNSVLQTLQHCPEVKILDVSTNCITDEGSYPLSDYLRGKGCHIESLLIRSNQLTAQAVRRLAVALESNSTRRIRQVILSKEGMVEAFADSSPPSTATTTTTTTTSTTGASQEGNGPAAAASAPPTTMTPPPSSFPSTPQPAPFASYVTEGTSAGQTGLAAIVIDARGNILGSRKLEDDVIASALAPPRGKAALKSMLSPSRRLAAAQEGSTQEQKSSSDRLTNQQIKAQRDFRSKVVAGVYGRKPPPTL